ncbi:hypothetical protein [Tsuneonella sp. SYSU-LHT278]|uniref:hypothetical protein n=1 Tax=Tsuneonella sediminis TaxID=3416089 RepID=UPI003F7AAD89
MRKIAATLLAIALVTPAMPAQAANKDDGPAEGAKKEKKICRQVLVTGSRMPKQACKTAREWATEAYNNDGSDLQVKAVGSSLENQDAASSMGGASTGPR